MVLRTNSGPEPRSAPEEVARQRGRGLRTTSIVADYRFAYPGSPYPNLFSSTTIPRKFLFLSSFLHSSSDTSSELGHHDTQVLSVLSWYNVFPHIVQNTTQLLPLRHLLIRSYETQKSYRYALNTLLCPMKGALITSESS